MPANGYARKHGTQWAAQFAVASELCKLGYDVAFTMGNNPVVDLMVVSPKNRVQFVVDVKGLSKENPWLVRQQPERDKLFYAFAFVPRGAENQFFIPTQDQVNKGIRKHKEHIRTWKRAKGRVFDEARFSRLLVLDWDFVLQYQDEWKALPQ